MADLLIGTQYKLPSQPGRLSEASDSASQPTIVRHPERGLHVAADVDVTDGIRLFTHIAPILH